MSVLATPAQAIINGLRVHADTALIGTLTIFWYHFPSTLEKLRKLFANALSVCLLTSAIFLVELYPCLGIFASPFASSPHRLTGVARVFPVARAAVPMPCVIFPIVWYI
ncbi:MAG: hypothetical protein WCH65_00670 [bacterium]